MKVIFIYDAEIEALRQTIDFLNAHYTKDNGEYFSENGWAGNKLKLIYNRALGMTDEEERNAV